MRRLRPRIPPSRVSFGKQGWVTFPERLSAQRRNLEAFIQAAEAVIGGDQTIRPGELRPLFAGVVPELVLPPSDSEREDRLWKIIQTVLQMQKRPMTAVEILAEIDRTDKEAVTGEHRRETIRSAMTRRPEVFEKIRRGLFALKDWPDSLKPLPLDTQDTEEDEQPTNSDERAA